MLTYLSLGAGLALVASLPWWMPGAIVRLRMRIFTSINGKEGTEIPGDDIGAAHFEQIYSDPAADGRSRGAALSDLFWYWLSPGAEIHQEHLEPGPRYEAVAAATRGILAVSRPQAEALATRCVARVLDDQDIERAKRLRVRDLAMPMWAEFYYELVFSERCGRRERELIVANADDVVTALKCCGLRHMSRRDRLTRFLIEKLDGGALPELLTQTLTTRERALYLQGVFFNTAVVQMSEATAHLVMVLADHPRVQATLAADLDDERYLEHVITETLRVFPLFGISHRITSADIGVDEHTVIPEGTVVCFNHPAYHQTGYQDPERFDPDRWNEVRARDAHYVPFGVTANRPCPARGIARITLRVAAIEVLRRFSVYSSASHTRSAPNRCPCVLVNREHGCDPRWLAMTLAVMRLRDRWEDVVRSIIQLVLGTFMVLDARRLRLCTRYFEARGPELEPTPPTSMPVPIDGVCPADAKGGRARSNNAMRVTPAVSQSQETTDGSRK